LPAVLYQSRNSAGVISSVTYDLHTSLYLSGSSGLSVGERVLVGGWGDLFKVTGVWWWRWSTRLGAGSRQGSGGTIRRWICRETTCQTVTLLEHSEKVCAPRAGLAPCTRTGWPSAEKTCAPGCQSRR